MVLMIKRRINMNEKEAPGDRLSALNNLCTSQDVLGFLVTLPAQAYFNNRSLLIIGTS